MNVALLLDIGSWLLLMGGCFFCIVGGIGMLRLPDFYTRTHAAGMTDTLGAPLILLGLTLQATDWMVVVKLLLVQLFLFLTSPTAGHALVRAAFSHHLQPRLRDQDIDPSWLEDDLVTAMKKKEDAPSDS